MAVIRVQGYTMITVPAIKHRFLVGGDGASLIERRLGVMCFSFCMHVDGLEINGESWLPILLCTDDHLVTPCDRLPYWDNF